MIHFDNLGALALHLIESTAAEVEAVHVGMDKATALLQREMKGEFGHYQSAAGPFPAWAELAESTKEERARLGYPDDEPLLREGDLRDSIEREVHNLDGINSEGIVGSTSEIMPFHEFGTSKMPPRPVVGTALYRNAEKVAKLIGAYAVQGLVGFDAGGSGDFAARDIEGMEGIHPSLGYDTNP